VNDEERSEEREEPTGGEPGGEEPREAVSEEELRARIEEQLRKVRVQDLLLESVVSVLNLAARRITKDDERDLEQARVGIEAVRKLVDLLDDEPAKQVRNAVSEVQVLYARQAGGGAAPTPGEEEDTAAPGEAPPETGRPGSESRLWTPPGTG
jgi:hypothetical protein